MLAILQVGGGFIELTCPEADLPLPRRELTPARAAAVNGLCNQYEQMLKSREHPSAMPFAKRVDAERAELLAIGRDLFVWTDGDDGWLQTLLAKVLAPLVFEVRADLRPKDDAMSVLRAPWELLASPDGFLAGDAKLGFAPFRRLGTPAQPPLLDDYRLGAIFMASSPRGQDELDFEAEERAILSATGSLRDLDLLVEDSGDPGQLGQRVAQLQHKPPVLHLSCHGQASPTPFLMMEDGRGTPKAVNANELITAIQPYRPPLLFLSACLTAAAPTKDNPTDPPPSSPAAREVAHSLSTSLVGAGFPAVLGWSGSVADATAINFAKALYNRLALRMSAPDAVAAARDSLFNAPQEQQGRPNLDGLLSRRDWHLPRLWVDPRGGGPIVKPGATKKRSMLPPNHGQKKLLAVKQDERLEVADPAEFVGRRRELQSALSILTGSDHSGLLIHGMGRLGKSSLAARISNRLPNLTLAVVFGHYDARSILEALKDALVGNDAAQAILNHGIEELRNNKDSLEQDLVKLLDGPCQQAADGKPVLLLIDDLERILEADRSGGRHRIQTDVRPPLAAVLRAFDPARSESRVLITSRFPFTLMRSDVELAGRLAPLHLGAFPEAAREKLSLRQLQEARATVPLAELDVRLELLDRAQHCAGGNPGLQDLLGLKIALNPSVPTDTAAGVLETVEQYLNRGDIPNNERVRSFLETLAVDGLIGLATEKDRDLLRAATVFTLPVPTTTLSALAVDYGGKPDRLQDLGLLDPFEDPVDAGNTAWSVNRLVSGRIQPLTPEEQARAARAAVATLFADWGGTTGGRNRPRAADLELTNLGLLARHGPVVQACATDAARALEGQHDPKDAARLTLVSADLLEQLSIPVPISLRARALSNLATIGKGSAADEQLAKGMAALQDSSDASPKEAIGHFLSVSGRRQAEAGKPDEALVTLGRLAELMADRPREAALAKCDIANILKDHGRPDEALRSLQEDVIPALERVNDVWEIAFTKGKIADILQDRGSLDEALRIRRDEQLPVYERFGDVRSITVIKGKIADILLLRHKFDEALRIRQDELAPVYARLEDAKLIAINKGRIADILQARGQLDEALRIRREEELPVYKDLDDERSIAITKGQIADILQIRREFDEALRIRRDEQLPVFKKLHDVRSISDTIGEIANIHQARGEFAEARQHQDERLQTNRDGNNAVGLAWTLSALAVLDLIQKRYGDAPPRIAEAYSLFKRENITGGIAAIGPTHAQNLAKAGQTTEALEVLQRSRKAALFLGDPEMIAHIDDLTNQMRPTSP